MSVQSTKAQGSQCWLFQRNREQFDWLDRPKIAAAFAATSKGFVELRHREDWKATRYFRIMQPGDIAFFWVSGPDGGLEGWGKVLELAAQMPEGGWRIAVETQYLLRSPISRDQVAKKAALKRHALFTGGAAGTNHRISSKQAQDFVELFTGQEHTPPTLEYAQQTETVFEAIEKLQLKKPLSEDAERLFNVAANASRHKSKDKDYISTSTVFFAACEWGAMRSAEDPPPRMASLFARKVDELAGGEDYQAARDKYFGESFEPDPDTTAQLKVLEGRRLSASIESVLMQCAETDVAQITLRLFLEKLAGTLTVNGKNAKSLRAKLGLMVKKSDELVKGLLSGTSAHVESDLWTTSDDLGYADYAAAFAVFLQDKRTKAPMTISIQAPWGGGKTSLMRMIQELIDPKAAAKAAGHGDQASKEDASKNVMTLGALQQLVDKLKDKNPGLKLADSDDITTIWFNAWTFQNHNQIWAGLGSAIIEGLSARLEPIEREEFYLRLNARRFDAGALRDKVHRAVANRIVSGMLGWLEWAKVAAISLASLAFGGIVALGVCLLTGWDLLGSSPGAAASGLLSAGAAGRWKFLGYREQAKQAKEAQQAEQQAKLDEPAKVSLDDLFKVPDYKSQKGFTHDVTEDLRLALELLPSVPDKDGEPLRTKPVVIFIDDLDRCPPANIAELFEAVNLFLAGEFPNCIIILGMDSEIVAASLRKAHEGIGEWLETDAGGANLGWRYMDKFVQLPFVVPIISEDQADRYIAKLIASEVGHASSGEVVVTPMQPASDSAEAETSAAKVATPDAKPPKTARELTADLTNRVKYQSSDATSVRTTLEKGQRHFSNNPRALKRLANVFRFYMNLRLAREDRDEEVPTIGQMQNWVILMMRWPDFYRWLREECFIERALRKGMPKGADSLLNRLEKLPTQSFDDWSEKFMKLRPKAKDKHWLEPSLMRYFSEVQEQGPQGSLAEGAGRGFW